LFIQHDLFTYINGGYLHTKFEVSSINLSRVIKENNLLRSVGNQLLFVYHQ